MSAQGPCWLRRCVACAASLQLTACMSMSGLGGQDEYACNAPKGVACDSVSGTYANAITHNLPAQRKASGAPAPLAPIAGERAIAIATTNLPLDTPLRSAPRVLRLWFKPWEDADHDLYDQGYVYVQLDSGRWLVDDAHRSIRKAYLPLRAPPAMPAAAVGPGADTPAPDAGTPVPYPPINLPSGEPQ